VNVKGIGRSGAEEGRGGQMGEEEPFRINEKIQSGHRQAICSAYSRPSSSCPSLRAIGFPEGGDVVPTLATATLGGDAPAS